MGFQIFLGVVFGMLGVISLMYDDADRESAFVAGMLVGWRFFWRIQSGMYVNCVYCGHRYGPGETTPISMADALKTHVEQCPKHPMSALKVERDALQRRVEEAEDKVAEKWCNELARHVKPYVEEKPDENIVYTVAARLDALEAENVRLQTQYDEMFAATPRVGAEINRLEAELMRRIVRYAGSLPLKRRWRQPRPEQTVSRCSRQTLLPISRQIRPTSRKKW